MSEAEQRMAGDVFICGMTTDKGKKIVYLQIILKEGEDFSPLRNKVWVSASPIHFSLKHPLPHNEMFKSYLRVDQFSTEQAEETKVEIFNQISDQTNFEKISTLKAIDDDIFIHELRTIHKNVLTAAGLVDFENVRYALTMWLA